MRTRTVNFFYGEKFFIVLNGYAIPRGVRDMSKNEERMAVIGGGMSHVDTRMEYSAIEA